MLRIQHDLTQDVLAIAARLIEPRTSPDRLASTFWMPSTWSAAPSSTTCLVEIPNTAKKFSLAGPISPQWP